MYGHPGISYDESSVFCATLGDGLMPITSLSWLPLVYGYMAYSSKLSRDSDSDNDSVPYQFYVGLKKVNEVRRNQNATKLQKSSGLDLEHPWWPHLGC